MGKIAPEDAKLIAEFIARKGVTVIARGTARRGSIENCDWMKGKKWSPMQRYKRAQGYARANGLPKPVWTDHSEAELLKLRAEGVPYREISTRLGVSARAAKTRYRYIRLGRRNKRGIEDIENNYVNIAGNYVRISFDAAPTILSLPAPPKRATRSPLTTPPVIYLPGPVAMRSAPAPIRRSHSPQFYELSDTMILNGGRHPQPWQLEKGSREQIELLEKFRLAQERAWYCGGLSREEIIKLFGSWPTQFGYPPYEWSITQYEAWQ